MNQLREEILISKAVGGEATAAEWDELGVLAEQTPATWGRLAGCLRDERAFERALSDAARTAESIELPGAIATPAASRLHPAARSPWLGWAVAAAIALTWVAGMFQTQRHGMQPGTASQAGVLASVPVDDLLQAYLARGRQEQRVIGEVPERVLVKSRPGPSGHGFELVYVRQIFEREVVPALYQPTAQNELGLKLLVRCQGPNGPPM